MKLLRYRRLLMPGSRILRFLLGQAAQTSKNKRLKQFYSQVSRRRGKPKAKVATAHKLLVNCYIMLRDNIDYQEFNRRGEVGPTRECTRAEDAIDLIFTDHHQSNLPSLFS